MTNAHPIEPPKAAAEHERAEPAAVPEAARRRPYWPVIALSVLIFAAGFVAGVAGSLLYVRNAILYRIHNPEEWRRLATKNLCREMHLTAEQRPEIEALLQKHFDAFAAMHNEFFPRIEAQLTTMRDEVAAALNEEQAADWIANFNTHRARWLPEGDPKGPDPPG